MASPQAPDVSVIVPAYNAMPYLLRCLDTIVNQTIGVDRMEVIVVDDGSTDGTGAEIDSWADRHPDLFHVVHLPGSGGPATPRNTGLELARGRYLYFVDADDYLGVEALERLVRTADENASDMVLGRMRGDGGRGVPRSMFVRSSPSVDLFESRIYWTLAPLKLFRREFVEKHELRFPTQFPNASDQPFTALAMLKAHTISVNADYDYYYAVKRDDGQHVTHSGRYSNRIDVVEWMCEMLTREVPDVARREVLLTRHFDVELRRALGYLRRADDAAEQQEVLNRVGALVRTHLTPTLAARLSPDLRVGLHLAGRGLLPEVLALQEVDLTTRSYLFEDDRAYAPLPFFRDADLAVPEALYDATDRLPVDHFLEAITWSGSSVRLRGYVTHRRDAPTPDETLALVLRNPGASPSEHAIEVERGDDGAFDVELDLATLSDGAPLPHGTWTVHALVSRARVTATVRLGTSRAETLAASPELHYVADHGDGAWAGTSYFSASGGLSIDIGLRRQRVGPHLHAWQVRWDDTALDLLGGIDMTLDAPLALVALGDGDERIFEATVADRVLHGQIPVTDLPSGRWTIRFRVGVAPVHVGFPVRTGELEPLAWGRDGHAEPAVSDEGGLVLDVRAVSPNRSFLDHARDLARRLRR